MNTATIPCTCVAAALALAACGSDTTTEPTGPRVLVAMPPADAPYDELLGLAGEGCLVEAAPAETTGGTGETADDGASSTGDDRPGVHANQALVIRHRLDAALAVRQQALTPEVVLATVCGQKLLDDVAYGADGQLIKPTVAPRGAECGLIVTLRVAELETRCEIPADPTTCDASATPCKDEAASSSGSGESAGSSSAGETTAGTSG